MGKRSNGMGVICVIVPVYNVESFLERCVNSILNQSFSDFTLVLVDDGSTDNSGKMCDKYAIEEERIIVIHKNNGGLSDARNAGIEWAYKESNIKWITFVDSDDWIDSHYLEYLLRANSENNTRIARCGIKIVYDEQDKNTQVDTALEMYKTEVISSEIAYFGKDNMPRTYAWGQLYDVNLFRNVRYPYGRLWEDIAVYHKVLFQVDKISQVDFNGYFYYQNASGIVKREWSPKKMDEFWAREQSLDFFKKHGNKEMLLKAYDGYIQACIIHLDLIKKEYRGSIVNRTIYRMLVGMKLKKGVIACETMDRAYYKTKIQFVRRAFPIIVGIYFGVKGLIRR